MPDSSLRATSQDLKKLAFISKKYFGLSLTQNKATLINIRLRQRLLDLKLRRFSEYLEHLEGLGAAQERDILLSLLTTNVTQFFREIHHFEILRDRVLPPLIEAARKGRRVRLWSAGCSSGQEVCSMAMTLLDLCPEAARLDIKILGTDIDPQIIKKAKAGVFSSSEMGGVSDRNITRYFQEQEGEDSYEMGKQLRELIQYGVHNLITPLPFRGPFDVVFCRNVAIYFARETQMHLWSSLTHVLKEGGLLCIGHSEHVFGPAQDSLRKIGITCYVKT